MNEDLHPVFAQNVSTVTKFEGLRQSRLNSKGLVAHIPPSFCYMNARKRLHLHDTFHGVLAMSICHRSKAALLQSCHSRSSWTRAFADRFFTLRDVHLEHKRDSQTTGLQRRHE